MPDSKSDHHANEYLDEGDAYVVEVDEILGHRYCDPGKLSARKLRNTLDESDEEVRYLVQGQFACDGDDDGYGYMRWLTLDAMLETVPSDAVTKALNDYESSMRATLKKARRVCTDK